jgi:1L-myo-inositol 1-phosphate cytidylyltransferase / CDP-L-myo-inositol myo-inositolphosphotransferase
VSDVLSEATGHGADRRPRAGDERHGVHTAAVDPRVGVVLAAGRSDRLRDVTGGGSKALVRIGGVPLVERAVRTLLGAGLREIVVVVGYHAGPVAAVVDRVGVGHVRAVYADDWELGNGASLAAAQAATLGEELFVLVTADHVFEGDALAPLISARRPAVLVDHAPEDAAWAEGTRVRIDRGRATAFSKALADRTIDCGAFVFPQSIFEAQRRAAARGDASLAAAVSELASATPVAAIPLPPRASWQDVDTPADLEAAKRMVRRSLTKLEDGPVSRWLNRPVSSRASIAVAPLRPHPDVVSALALGLAVLGAVALAAGNGILGAILVHGGSICDGMDGELARLQVRASPRGALLDGLLDRVGDAAILAGLAMWAIDDGSAPRVVVALAVAAAAGAMLSMASKDRIAALRLAPAPERSIGYLLGGRDGRLLLVVVAGVAGRPGLGLAAIAATSAVSPVARVLGSHAAGRRRAAAESGGESGGEDAG